MDSLGTYLFDGVTSYISAPFKFSDYFAAGYPIQFSCWFRTGQEPASAKYILGGDPGTIPEFAITLEPGGHISVSLYACASPALSDNSLNDNLWHHVAAGWD